VLRRERGKTNAQNSEGIAQGGRLIFPPRRRVSPLLEDLATNMADPKGRPRKRAIQTSSRGKVTDQAPE